MSLYDKYCSLYPELIANLENARLNGRTSHAYLIRCSDSGKALEFARLLAQICGCREHVSGKPDLNCHYCNMLENNTYPELRRLAPQGKSFQIRVGEIGKPEPNTVRRFISDLSLTSSSAYPLKIGIIENADRMNDAAQNAFLKTLEEPPPQTLLILLSANISALLPTTRSRCQLIELSDSGIRASATCDRRIFELLAELLFNGKGDLAAAENAAGNMISIFNQIQTEADEKSHADFASEYKIAEQLDDPVFLKTLEERRVSAAYGDYIKIRREYLASIYAFCAQCYMLSRGIARTELPDPDMFDDLPIPDSITPERGSAILAEADKLQNALRFNVSENLALRAFATSLAVC